MRSKRTIDSIAVLPFSTELTNTESEYLRGLSENIINTLSQITKLRVMAYSAVLRVTGDNVDPLRVGTELNVQREIAKKISDLERAF